MQLIDGAIAYHQCAGRSMCNLFRTGPRVDFMILIAVLKYRTVLDSFTLEECAFDWNAPVVFSQQIASLDKFALERRELRELRRSLGV
jgi:hypothetical protein